MIVISIFFPFGGDRFSRYRPKRGQYIFMWSLLCLNLRESYRWRLLISKRSRPVLLRDASPGSPWDSPFLYVFFHSILHSEIISRRLCAQFFLDLSHWLFLSPFPPSPLCALEGDEELLSDPPPNFLFFFPINLFSLSYFFFLTPFLSRSFAARGRKTLLFHTLIFPQRSSRCSPPP